MATKIDHVGVAVSNLGEALKQYCDVLGLKPEDIEIEIVEEQKVKAALIPLGESRIELVDTHGQSPWHFNLQALLDALRASSHSPTGKARGTLPFGSIGTYRSPEHNR